VKTVILPSGPRGAGKTTYIKKVRKQNPGVLLISRDEIRSMVQKDLGPHREAEVHTKTGKLLQMQTKVALSMGPYVTVILDMYNDEADYRMEIIAWLLSAGVERIVCWQFTTPREQCMKWFFSKPDCEVPADNHMVIHTMNWAYDLYHINAEFIDHEGFDKVYRINPLESDDVKLLI